MNQKNPTNPGYQTGPTKPPPSRGGLIAVLLVLVIFLGGMSTALGILNVRLFRRLTTVAKEDPGIAFSPTQQLCESGGDQGEDCFDSLGLSTQTVTPFLQSYYNLPEGVYITAVAEGSAAQKGALYPGDVIVALDGSPTPDEETLDQLLCAVEDRKAVILTVYKDGSTQEITLMITQ